MLNFSEKLKKCRKNAGLTQVEMADAIGVHPNTFRKERRAYPQREQAD